MAAAPPPSSSLFPVERVQLSSAPGPRGLTYNLTLQHLQPDDSALYSCQLLLQGGPHTSTRLGRQVFLVSVQGGSQEDWIDTNSIWLFQAFENERFLFILTVVLLFHYLVPPSGLCSCLNGFSVRCQSSWDISGCQPLTNITATNEINIDGYNCISLLLHYCLLLFR